MKKINVKIFSLNYNYTIGNGTFNQSAVHEIGHLLGLTHRNGGLMNSSLNGGSMNTSQIERGTIINGIDGQIKRTISNGTYRQSTRLPGYKTSIKTKVHNYMSLYNIK